MVVVRIDFVLFKLPSYERYMVHLPGACYYVPLLYPSLNAFITVY
jgi:hypothetical protein